MDSRPGFSFHGRNAFQPGETSMSASAARRFVHIAAIAALSILPLAASYVRAGTSEKPVRQVAQPKSATITEDVIARIQPGMTGAEVGALLGAPINTTPFPLANAFAWNYNYRDASGHETVLSVFFDGSGRVVGKSNIRRQ